MKRALACAFVLGAFVFGPEGFAQPVGSEFRVNNITTATGTSSIRIAADAVGRFVVVWTDFLLDGNDDGVFARRFHADGTPQGSEFRVNVATTSGQYPAAVAMQPDGSFLVVWQDNTQGNDIVGRRFSSTFAPVSGDFQINSYTNHYQTRPAVAPTAAGGFVVAWLSYNQINSYPQVYAQRVDASGAFTGPEFLVNSGTVAGHNDIAIGSDSAGRFVVAYSWTGYLGGDGYGVFAQLFDSSGAPVGTELHANTYTTGDQRRPSVAFWGTGFVIVWSSSGQDGGGIFAQRFDGNGARVGSEFLVNDANTSTQAFPSVSGQKGAGFVVTWESAQDAGENLNVYAKRFDKDGLPVGGEFRVNTFTTGNQRLPSVAAASGLFTVVWASSGQIATTAAYAQRYDFGLHGDVDGSGLRDVADVFYLINYLFVGGSPPLGPSDANGDGVLDVADVFYLINFLFVGGPAPV